MCIVPPPATWYDSRPAFDQQLPADSMSMPTISGIHHVTAIASDPQPNLEFYTQVLGLRLVKRTINFDDPGTYHLYFGNGDGTPGSVLTFFPWPGIPRGVIGTSQVSSTAFAVPPASIDFWHARLGEQGAYPVDAGTRFGERVIRFRDPDGMSLEIAGTAAADPHAAWTHGGVPQEHAICGFHSATLSEEGYEKTAALLTGTMGLTLVGHEVNRYRFSAGSGRAAVVDVLCTPDSRPGRLGAGTVHHIAFRTPDDGQQREWQQTLVARGYNVSPIMDRRYFHSIYFREPGGVLFEIATDPPGFAIDEAPDRLGERLMLPDWLEPQRARIEAALPPLSPPGGGSIPPVA
jgi:glyoxalase family protein